MFNSDSPFTIKSIFWNQDQGRLRALWRLLFQIVLTLIFTGCIGMTSGLFLSFSNVASGNIDAATVLDPSEQFSPGFMAFSSITTLIATLLSVTLAGRFLDRRPFKEFGFHIRPTWWADFGFGLALGTLLMTAIFLIERAAGWIIPQGTPTLAGNGASPTGNILLQVIIYLCIGIYEELLSRGYQLRNLAEGLGALPISPQVAILLSWIGTSIVFGLGHAGNPNTTWISTLNLILAGVFLGLGYILTGELAISIGLHITWNLFQGTVFGFPVSGISLGTSLITIRQGGPVAWTGGAFGPEAGLMGILANLTGSALIILWVYWRYRRVAMNERLASYTDDA
ncbi:MAG: CPBP family intramembrane metalloprotease [Anaerolineae bacterium]|nr:CPBP family intramembrane metalloprotease [Anaerolineae bacterium]